MRRDSNRIVGFILAAGYSSRMGEFKPLLPIGKSPAIERAVQSLIKAGVKDVRAVVGWRAEELIPVLEPLGVRPILNPDYQAGMYSSVLAGTSTLSPEAQAFLLLPADTPLVRPNTIRELIQSFFEGSPAVVYPRFLCRRGHPPIISTSCLHGVPSSDPPGGLRSVLARFENAALDVDVVDQGVIMDMDTPEDYKALLDYFAKRDLPTMAECEAILGRAKTPQKIVAHSRKVAAVARDLASRLAKKGLDLDLELIFAASLLHDVAKPQPNHADKGSKLISQLGFPRVAECIVAHMDFAARLLAADRLAAGPEKVWGPSEPYQDSTEITSGTPLQLNEAHLVYLADKLVKDDQIVSIRDRIADAIKRFADQPDARDAAIGRLMVAQAIKNRVEATLGLSIEQIDFGAEVAT